MSDPITARLRRLDELATELRQRDLASGAMAAAIRQARATAWVDMSPTAIARRLRTLSDLRHLCLTLRERGPGHDD